LKSSSSKYKVSQIYVVRKPAIVLGKDNLCKINSTATLTSLGIKPGNGWPDLETLETLPRIMNNFKKIKEPSGFESWMIIERATNLIIGDLMP